VDQTVAREIARLKHLGQSTRFGESVFAHVERVADRVPPEARNAALLHEIFELTATTRAELQAQGLSRPELAALRLLTHRPHVSYATHVRRIAEAPGDHGRIARMVKLADLDDHLSHPVIPLDAPPYAWARRCLLALGSSRRARKSPVSVDTRRHSWPIVEIHLNVNGSTGGRTPCHCFDVVPCFVPRL
jgi:hypothetical protein